MSDSPDPATNLDDFPHEVRAAVLPAPGQPVEVQTIRIRDVGAGEVRVQIQQTGVCHSDLSIANGTLQQSTPAVLGHEACGKVLDVGDGVDDLEVGQRVVLLWITPCRDCPACDRGEPHLCDTGQVQSTFPHAVMADGTPLYAGLTVGSFAEQTIVHRSAVVAVPDDIATADAALLGCAVTTGVGAATVTSPVTEGGSVVVIGLGGVGLSVVQGARIAGARSIIAIDRNPEKEEHARTAGATEFLVADDDTKRAVRRLTDGQGADFAFDCVGLAPTIRQAWSMCRRGGTATVVGIGGKQDQVSFSSVEIFYFARTLRGCIAGSIDAASDLPRFFEWVRSGELDLAGLKTGDGTLEDVNDAFAEMTAGRGVRTVLVP